MGPIVLLVIFFASTVMAENGEKAPVPAENMQQDSPQIEKLLERADFYFTYGWLTSPRHKNAYALYQRVITLEPLNRHATEKIFEIAEYYRERVDEINKEGNRELAGMHQFRYQKIIEYLLKDVLKEQFDILNEKLHTWKEQPQAGTESEQELIQVLEQIIQVLQKMENIYHQLPEERFKTAAEQLHKKIEQYRQLRAQYGEYE